jgi:hypothetical protein
MRILNLIVLGIGYLTLAYLLFERFHAGSRLLAFLH